MTYTAILSIASDCAPHADVLDAVRMVLADDAPGESLVQQIEINRLWQPTECVE